MELSLRLQVLEAAAVLLVGLALGLLYELLSLLRRRCGVFGVLVCDALFCLMTAFSLFLCGMGPGRGELRLYMPAVALGGAALYYLLFADATRPFLDKSLSASLDFLRRLLLPLRSAQKIWKNMLIFFKNIFSSAEKWFTIIRYKHKPARTGDTGSSCTEDKASEAQKGKHFY